jgi:hypothetical protein
VHRTLAAVGHRHQFEYRIRQDPAHAFGERLGDLRGIETFFE